MYSYKEEKKFTEQLDWAQIGGESEDYYFKEDQTGPTIIRFENIRNTGQETEFGIVVAPEFGSIAALILIVSIMTVIIISKKTSFNLKTSSYIATSFTVSMFLFV